MLKCVQCEYFNYEGQSPHNSREPTGTCELHPNNPSFYGTAEACEQFSVGRARPLCPACKRPIHFD